VIRCVISYTVSSAPRTKTAVCGDVRRITTVAFGLASAVVSRRSLPAPTCVLQVLRLFGVSSGLRGKATTTRWSLLRWRSGRTTNESHDTVCSIMETNWRGRIWQNKTMERPAFWYEWIRCKQFTMYCRLLCFWWTQKTRVNLLDLLLIITKRGLST